MKIRFVRFLDKAGESYIRSCARSYDSRSCDYSVTYIEIVGNAQNCHYKSLQNLNDY